MSISGERKMTDEIRELKKENIRLKSLNRRAADEILDLNRIITLAANGIEIPPPPVPDDLTAIGYASVNLLSRLSGRIKGGYVENYPDLQLEMENCYRHRKWEEFVEGGSEECSRLVREKNLILNDYLNAQNTIERMKDRIISLGGECDDITPSYEDQLAAEIAEMPDETVEENVKKYLGDETMETPLSEDEDNRQHSISVTISPAIFERIKAAGFEPGSENIIGWLVGQVESVTILKKEILDLKIELDNQYFNEHGGVLK